jgi:hypothetical protein
MAVVTLEDLQGSLEVVVFPKLYEQTAATWADGSILLVAGRIDHRGEEVSLLADLVVDWDAAVARGPEAFAREVSAGDRGGFRRRSSDGDGRGAGGNGSGNGQAARQTGTPIPIEARVGASVGPGPGGEAVAVGAPTAPDSASTAAVRPGVLLVSPLRPEAWPPGTGEFGVLAHAPPPAASPSAPTAAQSAPAGPPSPAIAPDEPVATYDEPPGARLAAPDLDDDPPLPDEARLRAVDAAGAPTPPTDSSPGGVLHVRFSTAAGSERVVAAMETLKSVIRDRPGSTRVVLHVPAGGTTPLPMELRRGVAYDAELLAEVQRRLGEGLVELRLA